MDKAEHGPRLRAAQAESEHDNAALAVLVGVSKRTIGNWRAGRNMPSERERAALRRVLGPYDQAGDPVEAAVRRSVLIEWRQDAVLSTYKRHLHEQNEEVAG